MRVGWINLPTRLLQNHPVARLRQIWINALLVLEVKLSTEAILWHIVGDTSLSVLLRASKIIAVTDIAHLVGQDGYARIHHFRRVGELLAV